jgi:hypothetical protein
MGGEPPLSERELDQFNGPAEKHRLRSTSPGSLDDLLGASEKGGGTRQNRYDGGSGRTVRVHELLSVRNGSELWDRNPCYEDDELFPDDTEQ